MSKRKSLDKLEATIEKGPIHFILVKGMIFYGLIFLAGQVTAKLLASGKTITLQNYLIMLGGSLVVGLIFGLLIWPSMERKARHLRRELDEPQDSQHNSN